MEKWILYCLLTLSACSIGRCQHLPGDTVVPSLNDDGQSTPLVQVPTSLLPSVIATTTLHSSTAFLQETPTPSSTAYDNSPYLLFANRQLIQRINLDGSGQMAVRNVNGSNAIGLDYDYRQGMMYWTDTEAMKIYSAFLDGTEVTELVTSRLSIPDGVAWDWVNKKLYWTDAGHNTIEVFDQATGQRMTLINTGRDSNPRGLVVDPTTRRLFWTDWGSVAKIERASMDGKEQTVLIDTELVWPNAITLDYQTQTLYWADANLDKIETSDTSGLFRMIITNSQFIVHPFAITVFKDRLYWSDWTLDILVTTQLSRPSNISAVSFSILPLNPMALHVVSKQRQPQAPNPCAGSNGNCSHLCLLSAVEPAGFSCACPNGMVLAPDKTCIQIAHPTPVPSSSISLSPGSCVSAGYSGCCTNGTCLGEPPNCFCDAFCFEFQRCCPDIHDICPGNMTTHETLPIPSPSPIPTPSDPSPYVLFANRQLVQRMNLDGSGQTAVGNVGGDDIIGLDVDYRKRLMFWSDIREEKIYQGNINGTNVSEIITTDIQGPVSLAWDWVNEKLYWTDFGKDTIEVFDLATGQRMILIHTSQTTQDTIPRGLIVDPVTRRLFWTDWGDVAKIERASMDGKDRTVLIDTELVWPNAITLDYQTQTLYWADANLEKIETADTSGLFRRIIINNPNIIRHPFDIDVFNNQLYWSDWTLDRIFTLPLSTPSAVIAVSRNTLSSEPMSVRIVSKIRQPNAPNPCAGSNGNCSHLCLLSAVEPVGFSCACPDGMVFASNSTTICTVDVLPSSVPEPSSTPPLHGSCVAAGYSGCCTNGTCLGEPPNCFCDLFCFEFEHCCPDIYDICSDNTTAAPTPTIIPTLTKSTLPGTKGIEVMPEGSSLNLVMTSTRFQETSLNAVQNTLVVQSPTSLPSSVVATTILRSSTETPSPSLALSSSQTIPTPTPRTVIDDLPYLLFTNRQFIRRINLDGSGQTVVRNVNGSNAIGLDYDYRLGMMYWTDISERKIYKAFINGTGETELVTSELSIPDGVAWDWVNNKLYWTDAGHNTIEVYDQATEQRMTLINVGRVSIPRGLVVDPTTRRLFWTDWGDVAKIERASMDGKERTVLIDTELVWPNAITLDYQTQTLYWADANLDKIETSDTKGQFRMIVSNSLFIIHPFAITVFNGRLYWSDWRLRLLITTQISRPNNISAVSFDVLPTEPMILHVVSEQRQPQAPNPCADSNGNCSHLCLLSAVEPAGFSCACPDRMVLASNRMCTASGSSAPVPSSTPQPLGSCVAAGYSNCCTNGMCVGEPPNCFCDFFCFELQRCCPDIHDICSRNITSSAVPSPSPTQTPSGPTSYVLFANRQFIQQMNLDGSGQTAVRNVRGGNIIGLDVDFRKGLMFWSDFNDRKIYQGSINGTDVTEIITTDLIGPESLAWDWINEKLYWTDFGKDTIEVFDLATGQRMTLIYTSQTTQDTIPRGLVVDPSTRRLFWTDWGSVAKIERASMDGKERTVLIDTELVWPNAITLDYQTQTLYWADANLDKIESSNTDGLFRRVVTKNPLFIQQPFDIDVFDNQLYWSDWNFNVIITLPLSTPSTITAASRVALSTEPMAVRVVAEVRQPIAPNPCAGSNGNCSHMCLLSAVEPAGFSCACPDGMVLASNSTAICTVEEPTKSPTPQPLGSCVAAGYSSCCTNGTCLGEPPNCFCDSFCSEFQRCCPDINETCSAYLIFGNRDQIHRISLTGRPLTALVTQEKNAVGLDYNYRKGMLYWTDVESQLIRVSTLDGSNPRTLISRDIGMAEAIAVDWITGQLYWTDALLRSIAVYDTSTELRRSLISTGNNTSPRAIVVDPNTRWMYWSDWGRQPMIERASMDGSQRTALHNSSLTWPNALTVDYERQVLYWADASRDVIESSRTDGTLRRVVTAQGIFHPFAITYWDNRLYWTDWSIDAIFTANITNPLPSILVSNLRTEPMAIKSVTPRRQLITAPNPCAVSNGNCSHLCLLSAVEPAGFSCACPDGMISSGNGKNCTNATGLPTTTLSTIQPTPSAELNGSCIAAGYTNCCTDTVCEGVPQNCYCDFFCFALDDCCSDFHLICDVGKHFMSSRFLSSFTYTTKLPFTSSSGASITPTSAPPSTPSSTLRGAASHFMASVDASSTSLPEVSSKDSISRVVVGGVAAAVIVIIPGVLCTIILAFIIIRRFKHGKLVPLSHRNPPYDTFENAPDQSEMMTVKDNTS